MNKTADIVMEKSATKSIILSMKIKFLAGLIAIFNKNPNKKAENVVKIAFSLNTEP